MNGVWASYFVGVGGGGDSVPISGVNILFDQYVCKPKRTVDCFIVVK